MTCIYTSDGCSYVGMDEATIQRLRKELGNDTTFISEKEYQAFCAASRQATPISAAAADPMEKLKAIAKDPTLAPEVRLDAVAKLLGL